MKQRMELTRIRAKFLFEPRDLWIGLYWEWCRGEAIFGRHYLRLFFILIPMFPLRITLKFVR